METRTELNQPYPPIDPATYRNAQLIQVSSIHKIWTAECGNPAGIPVIICHGGPGAGTGPSQTQIYDPERYRIILFDQRGARRSVPFDMEENTTSDLIQDMEIIREKLNIKKWLVGGGSWGSSLALLYAEAFPERVLGLILRGVWLCNQEDANVHLRYRGPATLLKMDKWETFKSRTTGLLNEVGLTWDEEQFIKNENYVIDLYFRLITEFSHDVKMRAGGLFMWYEYAISTLNPDDQAADEWSAKIEGQQQGITEITYMKNQFFIEANQIMNNLSKIKHLPIYIVQGTYDLVCPAYQAHTLYQALNPERTKAYFTVAGHAARDAENIHYLIEATNDFVAHYSKKNAPVPRSIFGNDKHNIINEFSCPQP